MSLSRRAFLQSTTLAAAGLCLSSHAQSSGGKYVDVHTHLTQAWGVKPELQVEALLEWMDAQQVAQAVVLPLISPESWDHPVSTDFVLEHTKPHRDRLIPFCSIDPRTARLWNDSVLVDMLKKYQDAGAKGFGEHKPGVAMDDDRNMMLFKACGDFGLPVLFHLDSQRNWDAPGLPGLEKVLKALPGTTLIGHATGFWASISGSVADKEALSGYPKEPVTPGGALDRLFATYPNLYGDLSAGSGANAISRDKIFGREFMIRHADKLLFGTDYLAPGQEVPQFSLFDELDLPAEVREKIFRVNARRLLAV